MAGRRNSKLTTSFACKRSHDLIFTQTEADLLKIAENFAKTLQKGTVIALHGPLGVGKTTFAKGVISSLTKYEKHLIQSPTFAYLHIYEGPFFHFDLYRISDKETFTQMGFLEYLYEKEGICLIEWPDRILSILPKHTNHVHLEYTSCEGRTIVFA